MIFVVLFMIAYMAPGMFMARGLYSEQIRETNSKPVQVVPPKPKRPEIKVNELLHDGFGRCNLTRKESRKGSTCTCSSRNEWIALKNAWLDYEEWFSNYSHIRNGVVRAPEPNMRFVYATIPLWPVFMIMRFITGGAKNIPNYREIERLEMENNMALKELN